jgi:hypothetical protein
MKRKRPVTPVLTVPQLEMAICFYDVACDNPKRSFEQITMRVLPRGFGESKASVRFKKEARKTCDLAR